MVEPKAALTLRLRRPAITVAAPGRVFCEAVGMRGQPNISFVSDIQYGTINVLCRWQRKVLYRQVRCLFYVTMN